MMLRNVRFIPYLLELAFFYAIAFLLSYFAAASTAFFQAGLASFFFLCACLVGRPNLPHDLVRPLSRPAVLLMSLAVVAFGVLGRSEPDLSTLAPAIGLCFLGAAFSDRVEQSRRNNKG